MEADLPPAAALPGGPGALPGVRVLDIACGGGDVAIGLYHLAKRRGIVMAIDGCDISARAVVYARQRAERAGAAVRFFQLDVLTQPLPAAADYDVLTCSLFLHHLDEDAAVCLLRKMAEGARRLVVVNDLRRDVVGHAAACVLTHVLTRCDVVHVDGPRSVRAAFTCEEALDLARRAGLQGARIRRVFPWRWQLTWRR